jgi:nicotinamide mononucleotide transporter
MLDWMYILTWILENYIEVLGVITSVLFTVLSIKQKPAAWIFGIFSAIFYGIFFFQTKLFAAMALQGYYLAIGIYGWFYWLKGSKTQELDNALSLKKLTFNLGLIILMIALPVNLFFCWLLVYLKDDYPMWDSVTTTLSIVATWMLARKYIENWIVWIVTDAIYIGLFFTAKHTPTTLLFIIYTVLAIIGFIEWKKVPKAVKS